MKHLKPLRRESRKKRKQRIAGETAFKNFYAAIRRAIDTIPPKQREAMINPYADEDFMNEIRRVNQWLRDSHPQQGEPKYSWCEPQTPTQ